MVHIHNCIHHNGTHSYEIWECIVIEIYVNGIRCSYPIHKTYHFVISSFQYFVFCTYTVLLAFLPHFFYLRLVRLTGYTIYTCQLVVQRYDMRVYMEKG